MIVLSIFGSPHKNGISSAIHDIFLEPLVSSGIDVKKIYIYEKDINLCIACGHCSREPVCKYDDDMNMIYEYIRTSHAIIISSPIYFSSVSSQLKVLIDRCQLLWEQNQRDKNYTHFKNGFFISTGGGNYKDMFQPSITTIKHFYNTVNSSFSVKDTILVPDVDYLKNITDEIKNETLAKREIFLSNLHLEKIGEN